MIISFVKNLVLFIIDNGIIFYNVINRYELIIALVTIFFANGFLENLIRSFNEKFTSLFDFFSTEITPNSQILYNLFEYISVIFQSLSKELQGQFFGYLIEKSNILSYILNKKFLSDKYVIYEE